MAVSKEFGGIAAVPRQCEWTKVLFVFVVLGETLVLCGQFFLNICRLISRKRYQGKKISGMPLCSNTLHQGQMGHFQEIMYCYSLN